MSNSNVESGLVSSNGGDEVLFNKGLLCIYKMAWRSMGPLDIT